ncbi:uncharacterized protein LOC120768688 [Bactrocera tryoni]|uniref:uncharacterized protein LOC120768688 n=1 Tax=Bactrocera tryoni TaxID=59916 RepID=UPI001A97ADAE|nr:uncharacterized protein LOC120768688 [Bactrocera tryoni]
MSALNLRTSARTSILRIWTQVQAENYHPDCVESEQLLGSARQHFSRFMDNHFALVSSAHGGEMAEHDDLLASTEEIFNNICIKLKRKMSAFSELPNQECSHAPDMRLDPVSIPSFDGEPSNWLAFKDMFETLVHNRNDLQPTYKLGKLRQYVKAEKVPLVGGLYTGGYEEVWAELKQRYDNPRTLSEHHVQHLLDLPTHPSESRATLLNFVDSVRNSFRALELMNVPVKQWDAIAVPLLLPKLPIVTRTEWGMSLKSNAIPKMEEVIMFVERRAANLPTSSPIAPHISSGRTSSRVVKAHLTMNSGKILNPVVASDKATNCPSCNEFHRITKCQKFRNLQLDGRWDLVKQASLCFNCLKTGHRNRDCPSGLCLNCQQKHNTLLCRRLQQTSVEATANVLLADCKGYLKECRALCDIGSQVSFVCESLVTILNLPRSPCEFQVEGIDQSLSTRTKGVVRVSMQSQVDEKFQISFDAYIIDSITSMTPSTNIDIRTSHHLRDLCLADPEFGIPGPVELLIGADIWPALVLNDVVAGSHNEPCALHTRLGWVVLGPVASNESKSTLFSSLIDVSDDSTTDKLLRKFWEVEEPPDNIKAEVDECEEIFANTVTRHPSGQYIVQIPFRSDASPLGNSHSAALRQFLKLERTLANDYVLREKYVEFMREYINLGHMEAIDAPPVDIGSCYYIPHHAVLTKFRVVFNASSKTTNGVSLNDTQISGPRLQDNLVDILHRFRRYSVALTADIKKMFRQVMVDSRHRKWQQILWRECPNELLRTYQLKTLTYGMASSPFNAIRSLRQCAYDNWKVIADVSRAAAARDSILHSFYVDDYLESVHTTELAINRARDVDAILQQGKFELDKWNSNCVQTLEGISGSKASASEINFSDSSTTVLGLHWNPITDTLFFKVKACNFDTIPTKRIVLSNIARLYDPLGLLAPVVVTAKMFVQNLWLAKLSWDTPLPSNLQETWMRYRNSLQTLERIKIPRWLGIREHAVLTLHGFCDASTKAYAAVIYLRNTIANGGSHTSLIVAKTRVAPLKEMTIPRLELSAAQLLVTTMNNIRRALQMEDTAYTLWSDSTIVLHWIRREPSSLKQYVANRIAFIQSKSDINAWRHIRSEDNPADCASRGITPIGLMGNELWWKGPPLIHAVNESLSALPSLTAEENQTFIGESRPLTVHLGVTSGDGLLMTSFGAQRVPLVARFSRLSALLNTTARMRRIMPTLRSQRSQELITAEEKEWALITHIRQSQGKMYHSEIRALKSRSSIALSSNLLPLNPILDEEGLLRVGGRLTNSELPYEQKHPIILANTCPLAKLLKMFEHFWKRWNREYLSSLQARRKWEGRRENLQPGDVVLIQNENLPPMHWRMGRITEVHPGSDGLVRIVTVEYNSEKRTPEGLFVKHHCQRPVQKICRLIDPNREFLNPDGSAGQEC